MARKRPEITDAELAVMKCLWQHGRMTVRDLRTALYPSGSTAHYGTVQKLLERLQIKKYVKRDRNPWPFEFETRLTREEWIGHRLQATADKFCEGSLGSLLSPLVKGNLNRDQLNTLRHLLDTAQSAGH